MSWTPEREDKLRELWKKGHTASQIATLLGNTTRNAVIGKAHRLNLQSRATSRKSPAKVNAENNNVAEKVSTNIRKQIKKRISFLPQGIQTSPSQLNLLSHPVDHKDLCAGRRLKQQFEKQYRATR